MVTAKKWVLVRNFQGAPKDGDLKIEEEQLPELKTGDVLLQAEYWTVDPYMRGGSNSLKPGDTMLGQFFGRVTQSKNGKYPVGTPLLGMFGWRTHVVCNPSTIKDPPSNYPGVVVPTIIVPADTGKLCKSLTLGVLGMPGATAYFGFLEICKPKPGETVLVNGAAGAVGSIVGQIAKIKGCKVIGFAGSEEKVSFIKEELGFDAAFNYKKDDLSECLNKVAPDGIDCYFDNVGGAFTTNVILKHMKVFGRVSICGLISRYNDDITQIPTGPEIYFPVLFKQLTVRGFIVYRWFDRFPEAFKDIRQWITEGKIKYRETITTGFENMYSTFQGLFTGENIGKAIIKSSSVDDTKL